VNQDELRTRIYSKIDTIPTLPAVFPKLLRLMEDDQATTADVAGAISQDPALTSSILKVANSAYYGFPKEIATLDRAVTLLGFNMVKSLALSIGVIRSLPITVSTGSFTQEGLWAHSLAVATAMEQFARHHRQSRDKDYLFVMGLLHDIGKVVLIEFFTEAFLQAMELMQRQEEIPLHQAELGIIGMDHGQVGAMLLARWKIPPTISDPIAAHHRPETAEETDRADLAMLRVADGLVQKLGIGEGGNRSPLEIDEEDLRLLGIGEKQLEPVASHLDRARQGILDFFRALH
jgi:putative nucleotidyltransferase with HDIG domain